jgi:heat shock protein HslJ
MKLKSVLAISLLVLSVGVCSAKGNKTLYVSDRMVACAGNFLCMQVREKASAQWRNYSDTIAGFNYQEGYEYKISAQLLHTANTLSGMYEEKYKLVKVISKTKTSYIPGEKLAGKHWILSVMNDTKVTLYPKDSTVFIEFDAKAGKTHGKGACNTFTSAFNVSGASIAFTNFAQTKLMCRAEEIEQIIFSFYKKSITYKVEDNMFYIYEPDGAYIGFKAK